MNITLLCTYSNRYNHTSTDCSI